jgi:hypothetical protein
MLVPENATTSLEEDEMYQVLPQVLAAQHITELHQEAARERLIRELRNRPDRPPRRRRTVREGLLFRQPARA